ncbi:MAG: tRNA (adenosine(37)-N6)-threonylcarbamoyltransferase complex ATPase subunit type 1 TsaE [Ruminococcus sp.]|nr:tRNA (adenosine(37)-N6)-threonylcarbamoyltransferase complex ATPase subunit type 1 TsaE [Ruminococcus sp.]
MTLEFKTLSPQETIALGEEIGKRLRGGDVIAYRGGLGAGKTTITRGISSGMGLGDEVTSPTFALVNEYRKKDRRLSLIHFDMYRITSGEDLETTGFFDYMDENSVLAVEWSENIESELGDCIVISLEHQGGDSRLIRIETTDGDDRFEDIGDRYQR